MLVAGAALFIVAAVITIVVDDDDCDELTDGGGCELIPPIAFFSLSDQIIFLSCHYFLSSVLIKNPKFFFSLLCTFLSLLS